MNNAKLWLVVKPTVGIPLFLSAVAIGSFAVHLAVLSKTTWYEDYAAGKKMGAGDKTAAATIENKDTDGINRADFRAVMDGDKIVVILPDGTRAIATVEDPTIVAKAPDRTD